MATTYYNLGGTSGGFGSSTFTLQLVFNLTGSNPTPSVDVQMFNGNSPCVPQVLSLGSGDTTINATNCPALATAGGLVIIPPQSNANILKIKGVALDTGITLAPAAPQILTFTPGTPPSSFVINASNATVIDLIWF